MTVMVSELSVSGSETYLVIAYTKLLRIDMGRNKV